MAIAARFEADYTQFVAATKGADNALAGMMNRANTGVEGVAKQMSAMESHARKLGAAIGTAFSVSQIAGAATKAIDLTGRISDLAAKAGISAEAMQELDFAAKQSGSSFDAVATALAGMGNRLVEGDKSAVGALGALQLSFETVRAMAPDKAFEAIGAAVAKVEDPMQRSKIAMDLFGRSGADLLPVLTSNIGKLRDTARESGLVMSNELVKSGDDAGDSFARLQTKLDSMKAQALLPVLAAFEKMPSSLQTVTGLAFSMAPSLTGIGTAVLAIGGPTAAMGALSGAFATVLPFLGPVGLIAGGAAAVYLAFKNWDKISAFAKGVYDSVKTYLVDKFEAIVGRIQGIVGSVTGFFKDMADKVSFHSYVPDMVAVIAREFGSLEHVMKDPTAAATGAVETLFGGLLERIKLPAFLSGITTHFGSLENLMKNPVKAATDTVVGLFDSMTGRISGVLSGWANSFLPSWLSGLSGFINNGLDRLLGSAAARAGSWLAGAVGGPAVAAASSGGLIAGGTAPAASGIAGAGFLATAGLVTGGIAAALPLIIAGWNQPTPSNTMGGEGMTIAEAIVRNNNMTVDQRMAEYANKNRELYNAQVAAGEMPPGYKTGTQGRFVDFGAGTRVTLHGKERVMTEREGGDIGELRSQLAAVVAGQEAMRRDMVFTLPSRIAKSMAIALASQGGRA